MKIRKVKGFTLMETLLALTLFAVVMISVYNVVAMGLQIWKRTRGENLTERKAYLALEKMGRDFRNMPLLTPSNEGFSISRKKKFEYAGSATRAVIPAVWAPETAEKDSLAGYGRIRYEWDPGSGRLCRARENSHDLFRGSQQAACLPIAEKIKRLEFRYWLLSGFGESRSWYEDWEGGELPEAVEVTLELKSETKGLNGKILKRTFVIPAGGKA